MEPGSRVTSNLRVQVTSFRVKHQLSKYLNVLAHVSVVFSSLEENFDFPGASAISDVVLII